MPRRLAFIPARGGSKRIPGKNIKDFNGKPMIMWAIESAARSEKFSEIIVSTDSEEIASVAQSAGVDVHWRAGELAGDHAGTTEVLRNYVENHLKTDDLDAWLYKIYPTTYFGSRIVSDFVQFSEDCQADFAITIGRFSNSPHRALRMDNGQLIFLNPSAAFTRTQDLEPAFFDAGKMYSGIAKNWLLINSPLLSKGAGFELPLWASVDLDNEEDWELAQILQSRQKGDG